MGSWNGSAYTGVTGLIASGRKRATGDGTGIITKPVARHRQQLHHPRRRPRIRCAAVRRRPPPPSGPARPITGTDTLVMYTYGGDATLDGKINVDDYIKIDTGIAAGLTGWSNGDFNYDGKVNIDDYTQFIDANIGTQGPPFLPLVDSLAAAALRRSPSRWASVCSAALWPPS